MELLGIPAATIVQGGLGTFGVLCLLMILTGNLIPLKTHEREMTRADGELTRSDKRAADLWAALQAEGQRADEFGSQLGEVLSILRQRAGRSR